MILSADVNLLKISVDALIAVLCNNLFRCKVKFM